MWTRVLEPHLCSWVGMGGCAHIQVQMGPRTTPGQWDILHLPKRGLGTEDPTLYVTMWGRPCRGSSTDQRKNR